MLVGRVIQGFGAAMAAPATLAILTTTFTGKSRNIAFGIWGATAGAAAVLGPLLGGYFTSDPTFTWRWAFLINVPIGAVALIGAALVIRESRFKDPKYTTDFGGLALITLGLSALLFGLIEGQTYGWLSETQPFSLFGQSWPFTSFSLPAFSIVSGAVQVGGELGLLVAAARHVFMRLHHFAPRLETSLPRALNSGARTFALLAAHLLVEAQA